MAFVFPEVVSGDPLRISASTFQTWKRCPASAEARFAGLFAPDSRASFAGSLAHLIFKRYLEEGPIPEEDFVSVCRQEIGKSENLNYMLAGAGLARMSALEPVFEEVRHLYHRFVRLPTTGFAGSEVELDHDVERSHLKLLGKIDAVFDDGHGKLRLVDWKSGALGEPEAQLGFYAMLWALTRGEMPAWVEAFSVLSGEVYRAEPTWDGVEATAGEVASMVTELRVSWASGRPAVRTAGPWCRWCPLRDECAEGQAVAALLD